MKKVKFGLLRSLGLTAVFALLRDLVMSKMPRANKEDIKQQTLTLKFVDQLEIYLRAMIKVRNSGYNEMDSFSIEETDGEYIIKFKK